jgi:glycerophosphoryl diester phosphodiesterase
VGRKLSQNVEQKDMQIFTSSFHYTEYKYVNTRAPGEWKYVATVEAREGHDLNLKIQIFLPPDDHAKLLHREQSVKFLSP